MAEIPYAELHCHSNFSFLDGASPSDDLVERAVELGLTGLGITDHQGLYGAVRFVSAAEAVGLHPIVGVEIELLDAATADPHGIVVPEHRPVPRGARRPAAPVVGSSADPSRDSAAGSSTGSARSSPAGASTGSARSQSTGHTPGNRPPVFGSASSMDGKRVDAAIDGRPARPRPVRARLPGHRAFVKEDLRGVGEAQRGPHLVLLAQDPNGYRSLCRLVSRANLAGTKAVPRFSQALLADHVEGVVALSGCRHGEIARRLRVGDREGARSVAETYARLFRAGFHLELEHHLLPDDDWIVEEIAALADELGLPVVVTNDVHYARRDDRELHDVLAGIRHGRTLEALADLRRPDGESYLKSGAEMLELVPAERGDTRSARAWREGLANAADLATRCSVDLGFEQYRFPGFAVPNGETAFSHLSQLCWEGARLRYHPFTPDVMRQLTHELSVIEKTGLAEFFLICWDLMRFAKDNRIPAQGRGSAADSIVAYVLGITRVDPIRHHLLFERFINEGRTTYPDVDIDFSSERREEVIQYVYDKYGPEHTGMVCNLVTYRARSAVREVGYALGFPRPLVDRVAKALETYDSVMVRRDLEAEGGFGQFFARPDEGEPEEAVAGAAAAVGERGLVDPMGQLNHARGGRVVTGRVTGGTFKRGDGRLARLARREDEVRLAGGSSLDRAALDPALVAAEHARLDPAALDPAQVAAEAPPDPAQVAAEHARPDPAQVAAEHPDPGFRRLVAPVLLSGKEDPGAGGDVDAARGPTGDRAWGRGPDADSGPDSATDGPGLMHTSMPTTMWQKPGRHMLGGAGTLPGTGSAPAIRGGGLSDDKGGPGDSPVSVAWLRAERERAHHAPARSLERPRHEAADRWLPPATVQGRRIDPESGMPEPPPRQTDRLAGRPTDRQTPRLTDRLGRPNHWDPAPPRDAAAGRAPGHSSVARVEPEPLPERRPGSTKGLSDWERWLEMCARIDGFPRHLSIHSGGMLVTAAPLIDIAPIERATMPGRVVVQFDKRDVETIKLIKLDLLGLGMLAAIDETLQLIEHDCAACVDLDHLPENIPEVFTMLQAADTVGVFQVESRAQMQTLPKSRPLNLDDLVVEVAIIRPGPIQGNAVHPYLRRKQGIEPVAYLHPSLEPILADTLGVILYQEQVMEIAIHVAGFTPADSDGFRRAMGTWRSTREMEKLHRRFFEGCLRQPGMTEDMAEELFRQVAAFASFGFAKSHAAAFARTAYESAFLKLFYPAQFLVGLVNAQPMGFYPVEVLVNDAKRHGVAVLPVDINASAYKTTTEWVGRPGWALAGPNGDDGAHDDDAGEPLPEESGISGRPKPVRSPSCVVPNAEARTKWAAESSAGYGVRLGLGLVKGIGEDHAALLDAERARGPYRSLGDVVERTGLSEEVVERLIRVGALDSLGRPRRELLWQLREIAGATKGRVDGRSVGGAGRSKRAAGRAMDMRLPATPAPELPAIGEVERLGDSYAVVGLDAHRQVIGLFRPALERLGAIPNSALAARAPGRVRLGGLVVTRQHPMTARGTVFLALEDETGMVNVTLWPNTWARFRGIVRRHALLLVDGELQREANVVNVVATDVRPLPDATAPVGGPARPVGVRQLGWSGMRRVG